MLHERPAFPLPGVVGDVLQWTDSCLRRGRSRLEASAATREEASRPATQEELEFEQKLQAKLAELEARRTRLESLDAASAEPGSLTRDLEAAWEVCKVIDALIEGREWRV